jgi:hypothetical protein
LRQTGRRGNPNESGTDLFFARSAKSGISLMKNKPVPLSRSNSGGQPNKFLLFVASCQFLATMNALILIWIYGTKIPEPLFTKARLLFPLIGTLALMISFRQSWIAIRKSHLWLLLKGVGLFLGALVLFDIWNSQGEVRARDIILLVASSLVVLPTIGVQLVVLHNQRGGQRKREE